MPWEIRVIIVTMACPLPPMTGTTIIVAVTAQYGQKEDGGTINVIIATLMDCMVITGIQKALTGRTGRLWSTP